MSEQRPARILIKVTEQEKRKFETVAKKRYTNLSELIRQLLHKEADTMKAGS